ncbi:MULTISPECIES: multidrug effflux MFS transporter [unclassified Paracoccus (in: a-proteobacteria)]|uniref:multidrug effflux MFS transporter n=1 Tax=unclassified Paracoccus (in: a-proteobacteria) TaxID=2688777 RepID=UPI001E336F26|nr:MULTISPECIES: multidrug effflux MFS transporter [unclassified Paracoccus (in: a-proteobacteria)]UXU74106.1 multidrug effflux MFS transporter [Paracoccus sp. SMMA_5]UXU79995.1 multidrug effflux MFS transporter [Paracoccus sp. SMMA_5_TC]
MFNPAMRQSGGQPLPEFIAMQALIFAVIAFSIDSMLPALPEIAAALTPDNVNRAQLVLTAFVAGLGAGLLFSGPLSDALGRKPVITAGFVLYAAAAVAAMFAESLESLLLARFVQGLGAAAPRIVALAMVRDLYQGREMARITSFVMMIFILVPAVAPSLGAVIIHLVGWRGVFGSFVLMALIGSLWLNLRRPETLPPPARRPLKLKTLLGSAREVLGDRQVQLVTLVITLGFGQMFALLSSAQQLFVDTYDKGDQFPLWFAGMALLSGTGTVLNARYVVRLGMRRIVTWAYLMQVVVSGVMSVLVFADLLPAALRFPLFFAWAVSVFFMAGVTFGNLNAMALQRMGHIAGMAASVVGAVSTLGAVVIAAPVGQLYDGTARPIILATLVCSALALWIMRSVNEA